jgi:hypothetical protein
MGQHPQRFRCAVCVAGHLLCMWWQQQFACMKQLQLVKAVYVASVPCVKLGGHQLNGCMKRASSHGGFLARNLMPQHPQRFRCVASLLSMCCACGCACMSSFVSVGCLQQLHMLLACCVSCVVGVGLVARLHVLALMAAY